MAQAISATGTTSLMRTTELPVPDLFSADRVLQTVSANGLEFEVLTCGQGDRLALCLDGFPEVAQMAPAIPASHGTRISRLGARGAPVAALVGRPDAISEFREKRELREPYLGNFRETVQAEGKTVSLPPSEDLELEAVG